jgi:hypothetical protein
MLRRHQATLGATELRVHAAVKAEDLATMGIRLAVQSRRARRVLTWAERWRAGALLTRPARPPTDARLADLLSQLRFVVSQLEQAGFAAQDSAPLLRRQAGLEAAVSRRARHSPGSALTAGTATPAVDDLHAALGDRALIELVESDRVLYAVTLAAGRARLHCLGSPTDLRDETEALGFALERLARGLGSRESRAGAAEALAFGARRLDDVLMAPVRRAIGDRPLVIVPTGVLHGLPWSTLPTCRGRAVTVAPSAALWLRAARGVENGGDVVLVAGPGLPGADAEIAELASVYPAAVRFDGPEATTTNVAAALDGAALAHIAAHGTFRTDNPLFSSVRLHDGPLTVYDLERLPHAPRRVVLSACNTGLAVTRPGDELMGLSSAFLALGTQTLVASVVPMPDAIARPLLVSFHRHLSAGASPAEALSRLQAEPGGDANPEVAAALGMLCFGAS